MKKIILFIAFFIVAYNASSQSKEETESWIIKQIDEHKIIGNEDSNTNYYFENGVLFYNWFFYKSNNLRSIQIKNIKNITLVYSEEKKAIYITLSCNTNKCCKYDYISAGGAENNKTEFEDAFGIILEVENSNLLERLNKAFKHLVTIYGGKATSAIKVSKEPF
jgi:hypothetical protein